MAVVAEERPLAAVAPMQTAVPTWRVSARSASLAGVDRAEGAALVEEVEGMPVSVVPAAAVVVV